MSIDGLEKFPPWQKDWQEKKQKKEKNIFVFLFVFLVVFLAGLLTYFFIFNTKVFKNSRSIGLKIETPEKIIVGQDFTTKFLISNNEETDVTNLEALINFPEDFSFKSSIPNCSQILPHGCIVDLPKIRKGENEEIKIDGSLFGSAQEKKIFSLNLSFQLANLSAWFKKEKSKEVILEGYPFDLFFQGSEELLTSEEGEFRIKVKNNFSNAIQAKVILDLPEDFQISFSEPEASGGDEKNKEWLLNFENFEEKNIDFKGFFTASQGEKRFKVSLVLFKEEKKFPQQERDFSLKILQPGLVTGLRINDSFLEEQGVDFGENLNFILNYKNVGQEKIFDGVIKLILDKHEFLNLDNLSSIFWTWRLGDKRIEGNQWKVERKENVYLIWDKGQIKDLEGINPADEGEISFSLRLKNYEEVSKSQLTNPSLSLSFLTEANLFRRQLIIFKTESNQIKLKISSKVKLEAEARYFDDEGLKIGSGSLPPKVGETTTHVVFLRPFNTVNEIKNIKIEAVLPEKITWLGEEKTSVGTLSFDNFSKKITWQMSSVSPYCGGPYSFWEASFKIGLTPTEENRGAVMSLLENIKLEADDAFTGNKIYLEAKNLDTNLESDDWAKGKGMVE